MNGKSKRGFWRHFVERTCELIDAPRPSAFAAAELFDRFAQPDAWEVDPGTRPMLAELKRRGHELRARETWGNLQVVTYDTVTGKVSGASDPRGVGTAGLY